MANVASVCTSAQNEAAFLAFVQGQCINQAYARPHDGHASHNLWQRGEKVQCRNCGIQVHLDAQQRPIVTGALQKTCKGAAVSSSPPLVEIFRRQAEKASQSQPEDLPQNDHTGTAEHRTTSTGDAPPAGHETQPTLVTLQKMQQHDTASPLAPRKLTYSEAANNPEDLAHASSDDAMNLQASPWPRLHRRFPFQGTKQRTNAETKRPSWLESEKW